MDTYYVCVRKGVDLTNVESATGTTSTTTLNNSGAIIAGGNASVAAGDNLFIDEPGIYGMGSTIKGTATAGSKAFRLPLNNQPTFDHGIQFITDRKFQGSPLLTAGKNAAEAQNLSTGGVDTYRGFNSPVVSGIEFDVDDYNLVPFLWSLFHTGASETKVDSQLDADDSPDDSIDNSYLSFEVPRMYSTNASSSLRSENSSFTDPASTEAYLQFMHRQSVGGADAELLTDAIVTSMTLSGAAGEAFKASVDLAGRKLITNLTPTATGDGGDLRAAIADYGTGAAPLLWNDSEFFIRKNGVVDVIRLVPSESFSVTITPEVGIKYYNNQYALRYTLNNWAISGSYTIPYTGVGQTDIDGLYFQNEYSAQTIAESPQIRAQELNIFWYGFSAHRASDTGGVGTQNNAKLSVGANLTDLLMSNYKDLGQEQGNATTGNRDGGASSFTFPDTGDVAMTLSTITTGVEITGDDESQISITFEGADEGPDGSTNRAFHYQILNDAEYGIDNIASLGTNTSTDEANTIGAVIAD